MSSIIKKMQTWGMSPAVSILLLANIGASLFYWLVMALAALLHFSDVWTVRLLAFPGSPLKFITHPWTLLTYMFVQADILQLLFNMLWLVWFGRMLLDTDTPRRLLTLYIGGGIFGAICYLAADVLTFGGAGYLLGSSAAILSVMVYTAFRQPDRPVPLFIIGEVRLKWIALVTIIITLIGASGIAAHCAHIGGAVFPFILIWWLRLSANRKKITRRKPKALKGKKPLRPNPSPSPIPINTLEEELDALLDKIRLSGFDSLSAKEKKRLDELSKLIDTHKK